MRPENGDNYIQIPLTFDRSVKPQGLPKERFFAAAGLMVLSFIVNIVILFAMEGFSKFLWMLGIFLVSLFVSRFLIMKERYFYKKREELKEHDFKFPYNIFWNIYEVSNSYPYICKYGNGLNAIFVIFEKDVIVGKENDNEYQHFDAISEGYLQMAKRGIDCVHIDYMDTVGKDKRIGGLFEFANSTENPNLREVLVRIFDNVENVMEHSYASYDAYAFFYPGKETLFLDELEIVIGEFLNANYTRCRVLNKDEIGELVKAVFGLGTFSVSDACEKIFTESGGTHYLTPIWVERGVERKILNKTTEEKAEYERVKRAEIDLRKSKKRGGSYKDRLLQKAYSEQEIDLFEEENLEPENSTDSYNNITNSQVDLEKEVIEKPVLDEDEDIDLF